MGDDTRPAFDRTVCRTAIKLLEQYERLAAKYGARLPANRLADLDRKRDAGTITSNDLPASLRAEFPGQFAGKTLGEIRLICAL
jgi:hypothetical protein